MHWGRRNRGAEDGAVTRLELEICSLDDDAADLFGLAARIRARPDAAAVLDALARSTSVEVRDRVPSLALQVLGRDALGLLTLLLDDPDADVRGFALEAIEEADPGAVVRLVPAIRNGLRSRDDAEVLRCAWVLVRLGDTGSIGDLEACRARYARRPDDWQHRALGVVLAALRDPASVATAIRAHDHEHLGWLVYAAAVLARDDAHAALAWGAGHLPDDECRARCRNALLVYVPEQARLRDPSPRAAGTGSDPG